MSAVAGTRAWPVCIRSRPGVCTLNPAAAPETRKPPSPSRPGEPGAPPPTQHTVISPPMLISPPLRPHPPRALRASGDGLEVRCIPCRAWVGDVGDVWIDELFVYSIEIREAETLQRTRGAPEEGTRLASCFLAGAGLGSRRRERTRPSRRAHGAETRVAAAQSEARHGRRRLGLGLGIGLGLG